MADFEKTVVVDIEYNTEEAEDNVKDLTKKIVELEEEQKDLKKSFKEGALGGEAYSKALAENREELKKGKGERQNYIKQLKSTKGSVEQLTAQNKQLIAARNKLAPTTKANRKAIETYNKKIEANNKIINKNRTATENQRASFGALPGPMGKAQGAIQGIGRAFKMLLANPIVAVIAAIVGGLIALTKALKRSEEGQNAFNKATAVLRQIFETILDVLTKLAERIVKAFDDPKQAVRDLWQVIKNNLVNRVKGLADMFVSLGDVITNSMKLAGRAISNVFRRTNKDLSEFKDNLADASIELGKALIQTATGIDADKLGKELKKLGEEIKKDALARAEIADRQAKLDKQIRENLIEEARLRKEIAQLRINVAKREEFSEAERLAFLDEAIKKEQTILENSLDIATKKRNIQRDLNALSASDKQDKEALARLEAAIFQEEERSLQGRRRLEMERTTLVKLLRKEEEKSADEMVKRREAALQKLKELDEKAILDSIDNLEKRKQKEIEFENAEFERQLENDQLLQEEREILEAEHKARLLEIDNNYKEARIENEREIMNTVLKSVDEIGQSVGALKDERLQLQADLLKSTTKFAALEEKTEKEKFAAFAGFASQLNALTMRNFQSELDAAAYFRDQQLAVVGDNVQAQQRIEEDYARKVAEIQRKQFNDEKRKAITDTIINTAVAVVKALSTLNIPLSIAVGIAGAAQTALIATKQFQPSSYASGGEMTLFGGEPHSKGGTHLFGTDGSHIEVERGESAYVLKRDATSQIAALSAVNESFGGKSFNTKSRFMQEGGQVDNTPAIDVNDLKEAFKEIVILTRIEDIKTGESRYDDVINNGVI